MAIERGTHTKGLQATLRGIHERFVSGDADESYLQATRLSPVVAQSWQRSLASGVDPDRAAHPTHSDEYATVRASHALAAAMPVISELLVADASSSGVVVAVAAADGRLLWVDGDNRVRRQLEAMNFVPGADWSEQQVGTNAPGTALALDRAVRIRGPEHFSRLVQPWNCTAVPIHDPGTGAVIGAIDLTGGSRVASTGTLALLKATAVAVEGQLALAALMGRRASGSTTARLTVLGAGAPRWVVTDGNGHLRISTLSGRHAEILTLLTRHPEGLTSDHLAMLLDERDLDPVTVRAEMSRLRKVIGADFIDSRPYRLLKPVSSDVDDVLASLDAGDVCGALARYGGLLLPRSISPEIGWLRTELSAGLRSAVLAAGDAEVLRRWLKLPEGCNDRDGWQLLERIGNGALAGARARGRLVALDAELA